MDIQVATIPLHAASVAHAAAIRHHTVAAVAVHTAVLHHHVVAAVSLVALLVAVVSQAVILVVVSQAVTLVAVRMVAATQVVVTSVVDIDNKIQVSLAHLVS